MKFNINAYNGEAFVMHCKTETEAISFCNYLHSIDRTWSTGHSYLNRANYDRYKSDTCYNFNEGMFCSINWYRSRNYTILEWSDFTDDAPAKKPKFTKAKLKTGDIIQYRDGDVAIFIREFGIFLGPFGSSSDYYKLDDLSNDLTGKDGDTHCDIVAVRRPTKTSECQFCAFEYGYGTLIYERQEERRDNL